MPKVIIILLLFGLLISNAVRASNTSESASGFLTSLPPDSSVLISPATNVTVLSDTVTLMWKSQIHTSSYTLQVSTNNDFSDLFHSKTVSDTSLLITGFEKSTIIYWRVSATNVAGESKYSEVRNFTTTSATAVDIVGFIPNGNILQPAYPNPFYSKITFTYNLAEEAEVSLIIYNSMGQKIQELISGNQPAGENEILWNSRDNLGNTIKSGLYICVFQSGNTVSSQKILLKQ